MKTLLTILSLTQFILSDPFSGSGDYVILLHGLSRTRFSMHKIEKALEKENYQVVNFGYPSTRHAIDSLANLLKIKLENVCLDSSKQIHFITHSMGGIVLRQFLSENSIARLGRVVMLSPPNQGSEMADFYRDFFLFKWIMGPAGQELGTDSLSIPNRLGKVNFEVGIIMGTKALNPVYSKIIPGRDDGIVAIERARVEGMADFIEVPSNHTFIVWNKKAIEQGLFFLKNGRFEK